ncbi:copper resistance CopC family protein [Neobacillus dielmonensis]|uniref:copper resistance CopC family protein n=1 Tax=Neobacillus dielmonensis TaxID=1347369 RepID=UPI0005A5F474|nr:copper resistance protein CopC [Neobacillus dielmonensis]
MKKIFFFFICLLVLVPSIASAHTGLESSNPASGQVITEDLKEISLTFEGEIESLSTLTLSKDGQQIPLESVPNGKQLTAALSAPLENGAYVITWNIAGEDGHPVTGEIPFTVQKPEKAETQTNEPSDSQKQEPEKTETNKQDTKQEQTNADTKESSSSLSSIISIMVVVIVIIGLFMLFKRKR